VSESRALATPAVLKWARESTHLDLQAAAKAAGIRNPQRFADAEAGKTQLTFRQLQTFAAFCRLPLYIFYQQEPPTEEKAPADFRAHQGLITARLVKTLRLARARRDAAVNLFADLRVTLPALPVVETEHDVISALQPLLCIPMWEGEQRRTGWSSGARALSASKERVERALPVLIFEFLIETSDLAGCSLYGLPLSVVGLSQKDTPNRRRFTLAHELVHILFRQSGMCDLPGMHAAAIERRVDAIASEALLPEALFQELISRYKHFDAQQKAAITADRFGISHSAAAVRLHQAGKIDGGELARLLDLYQSSHQKAKEQLAERDGGPSPYLMQAQRLGPTFATAVLNGLESDVVSITQAADLLGVPPSYKSFEKLREKMVNVYGR
jgi:Zn-dependent peptidase ImmA (M78 family)